MREGRIGETVMPPKVAGREMPTNPVGSEMPANMVRR